MNSSASRKVHGRQFNPAWNCLKYVFFVGIAIAGVVLFGFALFFLICLSEQPPQPLPNFSVSSFTVTFIHAKSSYQIALNFTVRKPEFESTKTMDYDNIVASLYYDNNLIGTTTLFPSLFPVKQEGERNSVAVIKAKFMADPKTDIDLVGVFNVRVSAITTLTDNSDIYYFLRRKLDVLCEDIRVESGSMVGPTKDCVEKT